MRDAHVSTLGKVVVQVRIPEYSRVYFVMINGWLLGLEGRASLTLPLLNEFDSSMGLRLSMLKSRQA